MTARSCEPVPMPGPVRLSLLPCRVCAAAEMPVVIASDPVTDQLLAYCSFDCARTQGWPWIQSEPSRAKAQRRHG